MLEGMLEEGDGDGDSPLPPSSRPSMQQAVSEKKGVRILNIVCTVSFNAILLQILF
jgi:hypothetical protein